MKVELVNGCFYHVYNRGVDKRDIFLDKNDYYRFITYLLQFNTTEHIPNIRRIVKDIVQGATLNNISNVKQLVEVISFCLIPNHFHMILRQLGDNGISKFMQKIETAHAMYFNKRYERIGRLFEGHFKSKLIETDEYLVHLSRYIHLNCLDLIDPGWKEDGIKDWERANKFLESYKWSSYQDYMGKSNLPYIINMAPLKEYFKGPEGYKKYVQSWMVRDLDILEELLIE